MNYKDIKIHQFDYHLPEEKIAKFPVEPRDYSKLLVYKDKKIQQDYFFNIDKFLPENSLLIINNTKVFYARLIFRKSTGAKIEIFCLNPYNPADYHMAFQAKGSVQWQVLIGNLKKWKNNELKLYFNYQNKQRQIIAKYIKPIYDGHIVEFQYDNDLSFADVLDSLGQIPIPPYLKRQAVETDKKTYQTVYSKIKGSVAAPTAGLHFTDKIFDKIKQKNINIAELTLHVGAGTFKPVKTHTVANHMMHKEFFSVSKHTIQRIRHFLGNITAVGTTSMRTLETLYWLGVKIIKNNTPFDFIEQWIPYQYDHLPQPEQALDAILNYMDKKKLQNIIGQTQIMIVPGYKFAIVDQLITNFHQPRSTLLLLVAAFVGEDWKEIYKYALDNGFRFLSYGDASLLFKAK